MNEEQCGLVRDFTKRIKGLVVYLFGPNTLKQKLMINLEKNNVIFEVYKNVNKNTEELIQEIYDKTEKCKIYNKSENTITYSLIYVIWTQLSKDSVFSQLEKLANLDGEPLTLQEWFSI